MKYALGILVTFTLLLTVSSAYALTDCGGADINQDGIVDLSDLTIFGTFYGTQGCVKTCDANRLNYLEGIYASLQTYPLYNDFMLWHNSADKCQNSAWQIVNGTFQLCQDYSWASAICPSGYTFKQSTHCGGIIDSSGIYQSNYCRSATNVCTPNANDWCATCRTPTFA